MHLRLLTVSCLQVELIQRPTTGSSTLMDPYCDSIVYYIRIPLQPPNIGILGMGIGLEFNQKVPSSPTSFIFHGFLSFQIPCSK